MNRCLLSMSIFLLMISSPIRAELPQKTTSCSDSADEKALLTCRKKEFAAATSRLASQVNKLKHRFQQDDPERSRLFVNAQKAWAQYRDAECQVRTFESRNGSAFQVYELDCLTGLTHERLATMEQFLATP